VLKTDLDDDEEYDTEDSVLKEFGGKPRFSGVSALTISAVPIEFK
jgi:hypothetical protein